MNYALTPSPQAAIPVAGSDLLFPVHRIYCIGRNYADHAKEMGVEVDRSQPIFFAKPADAIVINNADVPYPQATSDLHHEVEMIVALASGGRDIAIDEALACVFGYGVGLDLTRRDLQAAAKKKGNPWDTSKGFDHSAPVSHLHLVADVGHLSSQTLELEVNGERRQKNALSEMIFSVAEIIHELSKLYELKAGDLIFTGTPAGVSAIQRGDRFVARIEGVVSFEGQIV